MELEQWGEFLGKKKKLCFYYTQVFHFPPNIRTKLAR